VSQTNGILAFLINDGTGDNVLVANRSRLDDGLWHNVVALRSGSQMHVYIDGIRCGTANIGAAFGSVGNNVVYVAQYGATPLYYQGKIDDVELKAQSAAEKEKQEEETQEEEDQTVTDKAEKIKKLTAEFVKKHEELYMLAEQINELEKE